MCRLEKLTDEELVERIRAGETSCMDTLIERYKRQVRNQARTLYLIGGDSDDLIQEKEVSFEAFAKLCISRQLYSAVQAAGRQKHVPLNTYVELSDQLDAQDDGPQGKSPEELLIDRENMEKLKEEIWQLLSPMEKKILRSYLDGESYTETASRLNKSPKSVDNALQRIRRKLKKFLSK